MWRGREDVRVEEVPDPALREPTDAIVRVTTTAICGSDLHLYETNRSSGGPCGTRIGPNWACGTRNNSACPPGNWPYSLV